MTRSRGFAAFAAVLLAILGASSAQAQLTIEAAVLPTTRVVQVGSPATAFTTMINAGGETATNCGVAPITSVPADFQFQTTDPVTNMVTGTLDQRVDIPAGNSQSFVFGFTPTATFSPTEIEFDFSCDNGPTSSRWSKRSM